MNIIHTIRAPIGGAFRHVRDLIIEQASLGHNVGLICSQSSDNAYQNALIQELRPHLSLGLHIIAMSKTVSLGEMAGLWKFGSTLRKLDPDVIHGHGAKAGLLVRLWGRLNRLWRKRALTFYTPHGGVLHYDKRSLKGRLFFAIEKLAARVTDGFIFVCDFERRTFEEKITQSPGRFDIILNGLADEEFEPVQVDENAADFLFIGELRHLKGTDLFIDALRTLVDEDATVDAIIVGAGPEAGRFKAQACELKLDDNIKFQDPMPARQAFALAKAVVVPSRAEALPYIVLEAIAAGKPVIVSNVGGMGEIVGSQSKSLFASEDLINLTSLMRTSITDPDLFRPAKTIGISALKTTFSRKTMAKNVNNFYINLM